MAQSVSVFACAAYGHCFPPQIVMLFLQATATDMQNSLPFAQTGRDAMREKPGTLAGDAQPQHPVQLIQENVRELCCNTVT